MIGIETMGQCNVTGIEIYHLDTCLPDYFQGSSYPETIAVPVWSGMTRDDLRESILEEFNTASGWFDSVSGSAGMLEESLVEFLQPFEGFDLEEPEDDDNWPSVYAYFGLDPVCK